MKTKYKYLMKNTALFTISSFGSKILAFFFVPLYTSILTTKEYGYADIIYTTATLLVYIFTLNISDAVLRFVIEEPSDKDSILSFASKTTVIGAIACGGILVFLYAFKIVNWPSYCYRFLFIFYFLSAINGLITSYARAIDEVKVVAVSGVLNTFVVIVSNILLLVVFDYKLKGYLYASIIAVIVSVIYISYKVKIKPTTLLIGKSCDKAKKDRMIFYSVPLIFNAIAWWINSAFDKYSIIYLRSVGENGIYSVASKIPFIVASINGIFGQAWSLSTIKDVDENDKDGFFVKTYNAYNFFLVLICSALIMINIPLAKFLFAKDFFIAWKYSSILIVSTLFNALSSFLGGAFVKAMKTDLYAKTTIISALVNMILNVLLISTIGTIGAALATVASFLVMWITRYVFAKKYVKFDIAFYKQLVSYGLLVLQVIVEHICNAFSLIQMVLFLLIVFIYHKDAINFIIIIKKEVKILLNGRKAIR